MKIFGLEIRRSKNTGVKKDQNFEDYIEDCIIKCNNQLRGNINKKAKEYNEEIIYYWFAQVMEQSINFGIKLEQERNT